MNRTATGAMAALITLISVGSLVYLHLFAEPVIERSATWETTPKLHICTSAPSWALEAAPRAKSFWADLGYNVSAIGQGDCPNLCGERKVPCVEGAIAIDLRDASFAKEHAGETLHEKGQKVRTWATILLPTKVLGTDDPTDTRILPTDIYEILLAHELGHALGHGHTATPLPGPLVSQQTGSIMHPSVYGMGWITDGIEAP